MTSPQMRPARPREPRPERLGALARRRATIERETRIQALRTELLELRAENLPADPRLDAALDELAELTALLREENQP